MVQLESKVIELEKKVSAELRGLKDEVRSIRKEINECQSGASLSIGDPFSRRFEAKRMPARGMLTFFIIKHDLTICATTSIKTTQQNQGC